MTVQFGGRRAGAIGHQCEQRPLHLEAKAPAVRLRTHDDIDPEPLPHRLKCVHRRRARAHQPPARIVGHDGLGRAAAQDALGQTAQPLDDLRIVGTAAVEHDLRLRAPLRRIPHVLGQLR